MDSAPDPKRARLNAGDPAAVASAPAISAQHAEDVDRELQETRAAIAQLGNQLLELEVSDDEEEKQQEAGVVDAEQGELLFEDEREAPQVITLDDEDEEDLHEESAGPSDAAEPAQLCSDVESEAEEEPDPAPPQSILELLTGPSRWSCRSQVCCERGLRGAVAGLCLGGPKYGLWRDDNQQRLQELRAAGLEDSSAYRIYCGRCWEEFEMAAAAGYVRQAVAVSPAPALEGVPATPATSSHGSKPALAAEPAAPAASAAAPLPGQLWAKRCARRPPGACRALDGELLWEDEIGGGIFCTRCWEDFVKQGKTEPTAGTVEESEEAEVVPRTPPDEVPEAKLRSLGWSKHRSRSHPDTFFWYHAASGTSQHERPAAG